MSTRQNKTLCYLVVGIAIMLSMSAKSYGTGSISGTVTDTSSENISGAKVFAILDDECTDLDTTDIDGQYSITGLDPDTYEIHVEADDYECRIETNVVVTNNNNTVKDITNLAAEGKITGKVTKSDGTTGIPDISVVAENNSGFSRDAFTDNNGNYTMDKLPAGTYIVTAIDFIYVFPDNEDNVVTAGNTTSGVNLVGVNGKISGTVTKSDGITPIEGVIVCAEDSSGEFVASDITDSSGNYELNGLATGSYTVEAEGPEGQIAKVSSVSVTDGQTTDQDLSAAGGSISGTVKNSSQTPLQGAAVTAVKEGKAYKATTDSNGDYTIQFLPAGTYQVTVDPNENNYVADKIDDVTVVANQETSNQDFTLGQDGKITGTITDSSQQPIEGVFVLAIEPSDVNDDPNVISIFIPTETDSDGNYTIRHLRTGTYIILVDVNDYVSDSEMDVSVTAGQTTSGKNFSLGTSGGAISGTVYKSDGQTPIENAVVQINVDDGKSWGSTISDSSGDYSLTLLQAGTYEILALADGYEIGMLDNIVVTGTEENGGNDFTLDEEE